MYVAMLYNMRKITCEFRFIFTYKSVFYLLFHFLKSVSLPCLSDILKLSGNCEKAKKNTCKLLGISPRFTGVINIFFKSQSPIRAFIIFSQT